MPRERLFQRLDKARKSPIVLISAPAGAGKTTLVASYLHARGLPTLWYQMDAGDNDIGSFFYYMGLAAKDAAPKYRNALPVLTREYVDGLPRFTANFFREFFARLKRPGVVVLDNYQDIDPEGTIQEVLRWGIEEVPKDINIFLISRQDPPANFGRLRATGRIASLGWDDLRLTEEESDTIVRRRFSNGAPSAEHAQRLYRDTGGWVAGLVLLTEQHEGVAPERPQSEGVASQAIFDFFASEIFRRTSPVTRQFLLKTAFLSKISLSVARELTQKDDSGAILRDLTQRNYFTTRHVDGSYEYHPLFRAFLVSRAKATLAGEELRDLMRLSATLLADDGDIEAAVSLLYQAEDWHSARSLVLKHAFTMLAQGRTQTLERWLQAFPERFRAESPWMLYWLGTCRLAFAPAEARGYLEQAFALFEKQPEASPLYLVWSRIIESFLLEMNDYTPILRWYERYVTLGNDRIPPSKGIEEASVFTCISGLINASFDHPDLPKHAARAEQIFQNETNPDRRLARANALLAYHLWRGDFAKLSSLLDSIAPKSRAPEKASIGRLNWYVWKTMQEAMLSNPESSLAAANEALALADASGIHSLDAPILTYAAWGQFCGRNLPAARQLVERLSSLKRQGQGEEALYHRHASLLALHAGDQALAIEESHKAVDLPRACGLQLSVVAHLTGLVYTYTRQGDTERALKFLAEGRKKSDAMQSKWFTYQYDICEAIIRRARGEHARCQEVLRHALTFAAEHNVSMSGFCLEDDIVALYSVALEADICTDYVRAAIARLRLSPPASLPEKWPWPIRIYTLGRFVVLKDDKPLDFGSRAGKKPLGLLRALVLFGGRDVSVAKLARALWPEGDGDVAKGTIETALYRLRQLVGEECILRHENQLTLNPAYCWFDVQAFEQLVENTNGSGSSVDDAKQLLDLYRGSFLEEDESPPMRIQRERLRSKFLRALVRLGQRLEGGENVDAAIACYEKGIDVEPLAEDLYRRLMHCYIRLNRPAEALAAYQRCLSALNSMLDMQPTPETQALHREIRQSVSRHSSVAT